MKPLLILVGLFMLGLSVQAQSVGNYTVTRATSVPFSSINSTGNSLSGWRYSGAFSEDDNRSVATNIGFDFWYNGTRYTQFSVSTNGFLDFSASTDDGGPDCDDYGYCNTQFSSRRVNDATWLALAPFYDDMTTGGGIDPLGTAIKYQLSGIAPNRVLTVEWTSMAVYQNTTPNLNFQVKLFETSGRIEFLYGTMDNGTHTFSYTVGINAASVSNRPRVEELLTQQSANSANFSNSPQNNLSTMPAANSKITFTPPAPANPTGNLSITGITNTEMTLSWSDWATNEIGYVLYYSVDGTNYFYQTQTAANATSALISGLLPSTTYFWQVLAVTEGALSQALTANATTLSPGTITSITSGRWNSNATWDCNCIPTAADNVQILNNHNIEIGFGNANCNDLVIGSGTSGSVTFSRTTARTLTANGNITINSGAQLVVNPASGPTHTLNLRGNLTNNGILDLRPDANSECALNLVKTDGDQNITGPGATTRFYTINIDKNQKANVLDVAATNFSCDPNALNFVSGGTFKFSSPGVNSFSLFNVARSIPSNGVVWISSAGATVNFPASLTVQGDLQLDDGTITIGDAANENLISSGGSLTINGGVLSIAGRLTRSTTESTTVFNQAGGVVNVTTVGSTSTSESPFNIDVVGSTMNVSGGTIVLLREGGSGGQDLGINTTGVTVANISGGTLQIGDVASPAAQSFGLALGTPIGNLLLNSANVTAILQTNTTTILNNATLSSGTLNDNGFQIDISGDWLVTSGLVQTSAGGMVNFIGANQSITSAGTSFSNLNLAGSGTKTVADNLSVSGNLTIASALATGAQALTVTVGGNWINNGSFSRNQETIFLNGAGTQELNGSSPNAFTNITINKSGGSVNFNSAIDLHGTMSIQSATVVDLDGAGTGVFRLKSNATDAARIASLPLGASLAGAMVFEKYFAGTGFRYWRHIGGAVTGATVADLQNEIPISGTFTGNDNGTNGIPANANPSLYRYDPSSGLPTFTLDDRWVVYPTSTNTELLSSPGAEAIGYAIWVRETGPITFDLQGNANYGAIDFNISGANEGWNLIANPYPSDIDWDAASGWTKTDIQGNAIHVWNGTQYLTWNGSIGSLGNGRIAKGQGFWVQAATATPVLTATEAVKTGLAATTYRLESETEPVALATLELVLAADGYEDKSFIQFNANATKAFDTFDVGKLRNSIFNFSSMSADSAILAINAYSPDACSFVIPLVIQDAWNSEYSLEWNIDNTLSESYKVELVDQISGSRIDVSSVQNGYNFSVTTDNAGLTENRFMLEFSALLPKKELLVQSVQFCGVQESSLLVIENTQFNFNYEIVINDTTDLSLLGTGEDLAIEISAYLRNGKNGVTISSYNMHCTANKEIFEQEITHIGQPTIRYDAEMNILYEEDSLSGIWYLDGQVFSPTETSQISPNQSIEGVYTLQVAVDECSFLSNEFLVTALADETVLSDMYISPNPAVHSITVSFAEQAIENYSKLIIRDISGRMMYQADYTNSPIDVTTFPEGIYIVTLQGSDFSISKRFIKQ